jgi:hypothetical protein
MADQPEVLLRRFSFLQKGHDGARNTAAQHLALVTPGESRSVYRFGLQTRSNADFTSARISKYYAITAEPS